MIRPPRPRQSEREQNLKETLLVFCRPVVISLDRKQNLCVFHLARNKKRRVVRIQTFHMQIKTIKIERNGGDSLFFLQRREAFNTRRVDDRCPYPKFFLHRQKKKERCFNVNIRLDSKKSAIFTFVMV